jgi:hypothetical protein
MARLFLRSAISADSPTSRQPKLSGAAIFSSGQSFIGTFMQATFFLGMLVSLPVLG